ncbi:MAG: nucleotidyltransferase [Actinomycetota bacterium]
MKSQVAGEQTFLSVLAATVDTMEKSGLAHVLIGGIASALLGRPRATRDIDLFVKAEEIEQAVAALAEAGFETKEPELDWLHKADKDGVQIDIIFKSSGDIYLDDEMQQRALKMDLKGQELRVLPAEDLLVMKALSHEEETPQYWHDALAIISSNELDWDYLLRRARNGARRILSLLIYAQSTDLIVPDEAIHRLYRDIYDQPIA